jgi:hypothetical protein
MIIVDCEQGTEEWFQARMGVPSASNFSRICTTTGKWSAQADSYINELAAEVITGKRSNGFVSDAMLRGVELEEQARKNFAFMYDYDSYDLYEIGFCINEDLGVGCSPDALIRDNSGLEIKCPLAHNHLAYLRDGVLPTKYIQQVQGSLLVTDRDVWNFYSYHPDFGEQLMVEVHRDEEFIGLLSDHLIRATDLIGECVEKFKKGAV